MEKALAASLSSKGQASGLLCADANGLLISGECDILKCSQLFVISSF